MSWEQSAEIAALAEALCRAQAEIKGATRDSDNPFFHSKYADLASVWDACRAALTSNGLSVIQGPSSEGETIAVTTMLLHTSGQWVRSTVSTTPKDMAPQSVGSAVTYLRRYGLAAMVGVAPEDDDGNAATEHASPRQRGRVTRPVDEIGRPEGREAPSEAQLDAEVAQAFPDDLLNDPRPAFAAGNLDCPRCGKKVRQSTPEKGGGWYCWAKKGGCGGKWPAMEDVAPPVSNPPPASHQDPLATKALREALILRAKKLADSLGFTPAERKAHWVTYCEAATPENVDPAALHDLVAWMETRVANRG